MIKKISIVTGSRADYGLLRKLIQLIKDDSEMKLEIISAGSHHSRVHGETYNEIESDGFKIDFKIDTLNGFVDEIGTISSIGKVQVKVAEIFNISRPHLLVVLGDRYEIFAAALSALILQIPIAHIHGGELTYGAIDDSFRHAISKFSHFHFVATEKSKKRVIQLGESPDRVFLVGGMGADVISQMPYTAKNELEKILNHKFGTRNLVVTYHPETNSLVSPKPQIDELLKALDCFEDIHLIFTGVNADPNSIEIHNSIKNFVASRSNSIYISSLGMRNYLSCIIYSDGVIGNSSSGLLEVPSLKKSTINIGNRQAGRELASSVINSDLNSENIIRAIKHLYSSEHQMNLINVVNPYGESGASLKIYKKIKELLNKNIGIKTFFDISSSDY